ncbi:MAG: B12-binding domain-containing radical SAM protein [Candidatus Brocadiaceae bacterium]|nr:B12-binding domain-containing radical SAM protein [Candidatus Brocadiaceae bacterium]
MHILFINFNIGSTVGINNGLAILSAVLKKRGHKVDLLFLSEELGYDFDLERIRQDIIRLNPDMIGISLMEPQFKYMEALCADLRSYCKGFVVCGGPYPTMDPETVLSVKAVDAVCVGEGEGALCELVEALEAGEDVTHIRNVWYKMPDGTIVKNKLRPLTDISVLPPEDKELFELDKLLPLKNFQLETMLGRGCVYKCSYCINDSYVALYNKYGVEPTDTKSLTRMKNVDTVLEEIQNVISKYPGVRKIAFIDDNFLMYPGFVEEFYRRYKEEIGLPFMCNINPMSFTRSKGIFLKDAGCDDIRFGIESGSERVKREIMKRPITNKSVMNAFHITNELGLMSSSFNMIGLPTETKEEVYETLKLNAAILPDTIKLMTFYPFKNTPIYDMCEKLNLIDYDKKRELDDYDTFTCLKFPENYQLLLKKIQTIFNWYINMFLENGASSEYRKLVEKSESMGIDEWRDYDVLLEDKAVSKKMKKRGILHYSKFLNRSLAVKFPSRHFQNEI